MQSILKNLPNSLYIIIFLAFSLARAGAAAGSEPVRLAYIGATGSASFAGVELGLKEANLQGRFLDHRFSVDRIAPDGIDALDPSAYAAILAALDARNLRVLAQQAGATPVLNLTAKEDALRADCLPNVFHIIQSRAMERDAVRQWGSKHPGRDVEALGWHHDFVKYAARDLNKRFTGASGRPMDERAWAGWAAVRMLADVVIRSGSADPARITDYLKTRLAFDGQKGLDMTFRVTGQLRQPLLLAEDGELAGEAPVRGVVAANDYDSLGITGCSK
jgi:hypothetical protein